MGRTVSPLRYPGGKYKIYSRVKNLVDSCGFKNRTYVEPFSGGFAIGIGLLRDRVVSSVIINDVDTHIYHFWDTAINHTEELVDLINSTAVTMDVREEQKAIYNNPTSDSISDGFATLFLNRVNYSGVIKGGPIGGFSQSGRYKLDCRFPKDEIIARIRAVSQFRDDIRLYNKDAKRLIPSVLAKEKDLFFYIDPPYVVKGSYLYNNYFKENDHRELSEIIKNDIVGIPWVVTYDDSNLVRTLYKDFYIEEYEIMHNARVASTKKELVITNIPTKQFTWQDSKIQG